MLTVDVNEENHSILVERNSTTIGEGRFMFDRPTHVCLVIFIQVSISPDDKQQIDELLFHVTSYLGPPNNACIVIRLPLIFDNQIDINELKFKNQTPQFMVVNISELKFDDDNLSQYNREQYTMITDKQIILNYSQQLTKLMNIEAYWAKKWDEKEICNRINSSSNVAMIIDNENNFPCGFARLYSVQINNPKGEEEILGCLNDIIISNLHQTKGLGRAIVNLLLDSKQRQANGSLCLFCADKGIGAISAPKLYKKCGFEYLSELGNRIGIFVNEEHYFISE